MAENEITFVTILKLHPHEYIVDSSKNKMTMKMISELSEPVRNGDLNKLYLSFYHKELEHQTPASWNDNLKIQILIFYKRLIIPMT